MNSISEPIEILVIGLGAVGTLYSWVLSRSSNVRVTAVARSSFKAFNEHGITLDSEKFGKHEGWKPYRLVEKAEEANDRKYNYIVVCFKCVPDLLPSASVLAPFIEGPFGQPRGIFEDGPTVVLIQNGIGIEHPIQTAFPQTPIISVVAWIGANLKPNGLVTHGALEKLVMGLYLGEGHATLTASTNSDDTIGDLFADPAGYKLPGGELRMRRGLVRLERFVGLLRAGGGTVEVAEDIQPKRYEKNLWNASWSSLCSLSRSSVTTLVSPELLPFTLPVIRRLMLEVIYVAREWGYSEDVLPLKAIDDAIQLTITNYQVKTDPSSTSTFTAATTEFKPSMLLDIEAGRPSELEPIIGSLLDRARAKGLETPRLDLAYCALKVAQQSSITSYASSASYQNHIKEWFLRKPSVAGAKLERVGEEESNVLVGGGKGKKVTGKPVMSPGLN